MTAIHHASRVSRENSYVDVNIYVLVHVCVVVHVCVNVHAILLFIYIFFS